MKSVVQELLRQYIKVETQFQSGHYDKCVATLRDQYKDNMAEVTGCIFSHSQCHKKNFLVIKLIVSTQGSL